MNTDRTPIATIGMLLATAILGILGDALILTIAPRPLTASDHVWWALIPAALIHRLGPWVFLHYRHLTGLASWGNIHAWATRYPGLWRWITVAGWWWIIAAVLTSVITIWLVWRTPNKPDEFLRGTRLPEDIKAYLRLQRDLKREE